MPAAIGASDVKRLAAAAVLLALVHGLVSLGRAMMRTDEPLDGAAPVTPGPMTSAAGGPITDLALQFHAPGPAPVARVLGDIIAALDPATRVHVVVGDDTDEPPLRALASGRRHVISIRAGRTITSWVHDRLLVLDPPHRGGAPTLVAPPEPHAGSAARVGDWRVPWDLTAARLGRDARARVVAARFQFEGGDLIADERRVYAAPRILRHAANPDRPRAALVAEIERTVGRPVLFVGDDAHPVPDHHVGMFVLPLGGDRVLVADPRLALATLREAGLDAASTGTLEVGGAPLPLDLAPATLARFDNLAHTLRAAGLEVIALPALPSPEPTVLVSYANGMLERRRDGKLHFLMPTYGVPALDRAATAVLRAHGVVVHPIRVDDVFRMGGSVGCLVAPLARL